MNLKPGIIAVLLVIAMLALVPAVSAETTFTPRGYAATATAPNPGSCSNTSAAWVYSGDTIHYGTTSEVYTVWRGHCSGTSFVTAGYYRSQIGSGQSGDVMLNYTEEMAPGFPKGVMFDSNFGQRATYLFLYGNQSAPTLNYANFTINMKSNTTGMNIPRVDVILRSSSTSTLEGKTDLEGNITFGLVGVLSNYQPIITGSKVGYNTSMITITDNLNITLEIYRSISLDDVPAPPGGTATVYLDIADVDTGSAISGAIVGIQNTTATIDQWTYGTYTGSTIPFNKTGVAPAINLSVGQNIAFAGYKSGVYEANNTGTYQIPSPISRLTLLLKKIVGNTSAQYHYPVTITDAPTGNAIGDSTLKTAFYSGGIHSNWYNSTSATGKFNMTGVGTGGQIPLKSGDIVSLTGNATGYIEGGFFLQVDEDSNGVTQFVNLVPSSYQPISGEFTAVILVYDEDSTAAISGASVSMKIGNPSTVKTTGASGVVAFKNLTAGDAHQMSVSKTGYTKVTKNIVGGSEDVIYEDVPMSSIGVNPTYSITTTPTSNASAGAMNEKGAAGLTQWIDYLIMVSGLVFVGLMILFGAKVVRAVRDALGI